MSAGVIDREIHGDDWFSDEASNEHRGRETPIESRETKSDRYSSMRQNNRHWPQDDQVSHQGHSSSNNYNHERRSEHNGHTPHRYQNLQHSRTNEREYREAREFRDPSIPQKPAPITYTPNLEDESFDILNQGNKAGRNFLNEWSSHKINVSGPDVPEPCTKFDSMHLSETILKNVASAGYTNPTPCQAYCIPAILQNRDCICRAYTGSGKTGAFLLPILTNLVNEKSQETPNQTGQAFFPEVLILQPTRELVMQTFYNMKKLSKGTGIGAAMCFGGTSASFQRASLYGRKRVLIATIGRLMDLIERNRICLSSTKYLVLDEADRLLDSGFLNDIEAIFKMIHSPKNVAMFSATFPADLQEIASKYLKSNYVFISIGILGSANPDIKQELHKADGVKFPILRTELDKNPESKAIVFVKTKKMADFIATKLSSLNYRCNSIHGDRFQSQRSQALIEFSSDKCNILVATDVAARGLDIPNVDLVINYDMPSNVDTYVHRIGRTGRVGNCGTSISFVDLNIDMPILVDLHRTLRDSNQPVPEWLSHYSSTCDSTNKSRSEIENDFRNLTLSNRSSYKNDNLVVKERDQSGCETESDDVW